jgi:hypothetical protein
MTQNTPPEKPLELPRQVVVDMYKVCAALLEGSEEDPGYVPPPPGSTAKKLPDHILALIVPRPYISTACDTAESVEQAMVRYPEYAKELGLFRNWLHQEECRLNHKFTDVPCRCVCHTTAKDTDA